MSLLRDTLQYFKAGTCVAYNSGFTRHMCSTDRVIISLCSDSQCNNCYQRTETEFSSFTACVGTGQSKGSAGSLFGLDDDDSDSGERPMPPLLIAGIAVAGSTFLAMTVFVIVKARKYNGSYRVSQPEPTDIVPPSESSHTVPMRRLRPNPPTLANAPRATAGNTATTGNAGNRATAPAPAPSAPPLSIDTNLSSAPPPYETLTPRTPSNRV